MNNIRFNVNETAAAVSRRRLHFFHHIHDALIAELTMLRRRENHMEVVGVIMHVEEHGTSITATSRQRLYGRD